MNTAVPNFPRALNQLAALGRRLRLARQRRRINAELFAERMGVTRKTLQRLEAGDPLISTSTLLRALRVLGLDADINSVGRDDLLKRKLKNIELHRQKNPCLENPTDDERLSQG